MKIRFRTSWLPRIGLAIFATLITLAGVEIVVRLILAESLRSKVDDLTKRKEVAEQLLASKVESAVHQVFRDHPYYGYTMQPQLTGAPLGWRFETDRAGFRNGHDFELRKVPKDTIVIGLFGGSAPFGWEIDGNQHTLARHLEDRFNSTNTTGARYRVVNLAIPGWHYPQQFFLLSRIIEHLDGVITYDGFNEIMAPLGNTFAYKNTLPPDFPTGMAYLPFMNRQSPAQNLAMYGLFSYEASYEPDGFLSNSALYNFLRHKSGTRRRNDVSRLIQEGAFRPKDSPAHEESKFDKAATRYDTVVAYGVSEHAKYSRFVDQIAEERGVAVLHVLQPFMYAEPGGGVDAKHVPSYARLAFANGHPSVHYAKLRKSFAALARQSQAQASVQYVDLSDALGTDPANWIDLIHSSARGYRTTAERIHSFVEQSGINFRAQIRKD